MWTVLAIAFSMCLFMLCARRCCPRGAKSMFLSFDCARCCRPRRANSVQSQHEDDDEATTRRDLGHSRGPRPRRESSRGRPPPAARPSACACGSSCGRTAPPAPRPWPHTRSRRSPGADGARGPRRGRARRVQRQRAHRLLARLVAREHRTQKNERALHTALSFLYRVSSVKCDKSYERYM